MAMVYHKTFRVPVWVVVDVRDTDRNKEIMDYFVAREARSLEWPAKTFGKTLLEHRKKGWTHALPETRPFTLDVQLLNLAATRHVKQEFSETSCLGTSVTLPTDRINRKIDSDADFERIFNDLLSLEDDMALSQVFQVAERCHNEYAKRETVWVTSAPVPKKVLTAIADRVITIGDGEGFDVNLSNAINADLVEKLDSEFIKFSNK